MGGPPVVVETVLAVIGIGQTLRGDDAAGLIAVQSWQETYPDQAADPRIRVELAETPGLGLLDSILDLESILLVDALKTASNSGKMVSIHTEDELLGFSAGTGSAHGLGVAETLHMGRVLEPDRMPAQIVIIGIHANSFEPGAGLSTRIMVALPHITSIIHQQVKAFLK